MSLAFSLVAIAFTIANLYLYFRQHQNITSLINSNINQKREAESLNAKLKTAWAQLKDNSQAIAELRQKQNSNHDFPDESSRFKKIVQVLGDTKIAQDWVILTMEKNPGMNMESAIKDCCSHLT